jgi:broad specificity phosphatase PhoE
VAPGPSLSEEGRAQARAVGEVIAAWRPFLPTLSSVYASPLTRAQETAALVGQCVGLPVQEEPGLVDLDVGTWAGMELDQLAKQPGWTTVAYCPSAFRFPGGEAMVAMQGRVLGAVRALAGRHPGESIIAVSHADPIKTVLADALGVHFDLFQRIIVGPASLSAVCYANDGPRVLAINWLASPDQLPRFAGVGRRRR